MNRLLSCALGLVALTAGCDKGNPPSGATTTPSASGSAVRSSAAAKASARAAKKQKPAEPELFDPIATGENITIYPMGSSAIVDTGAFYGVLGDGPLEQDPTLFRSSIEKAPGKTVISPTAPLTDFRGVYPDHAWASGDKVFMKLVGQVWTKQELLKDGEKLLDLTPWEKKRAIAAVRKSTADIRFTLAGSPAGGVLPAPGKPTAEQAGCAVRMDPDAEVKLAGLPTGHLFALGKECKTGKLIVERWAPGKAQGEVAVLDRVSGTPVAIAAHGPDEAYALFVDGKKGYISIWDGKTWRGSGAPFGTPKSMWTAADGALFVLGSGLYLRPKGGPWEEIKVGKMKVSSAWARDPKVVWIVEDGKTLHRLAPRTNKPIKLPLVADVKAMIERDQRWPASEVCKKVYVQLASIGPSDKVPASFAALTAAVKDDAELTAKEIQYVAEDVGGTLYAGAKVPSLAVAEKLVNAFKAKQADSKPAVFCHDPAVKGPLKLE